MAFNAWPRRGYILSEDCVYPGDDDYENDNPWPGEDDNWQEAVNALREDVDELSDTVSNLAKQVDDITVPTKVSELQNDSGFQTAAQVTAAINAALAQIPFAETGVF